MIGELELREVGGGGGGLDVIGGLVSPHEVLNSVSVGVVVTIGTVTDICTVVVLVEAVHVRDEYIHYRTA